MYEVTHIFYTFLNDFDRKVFDNTLDCELASDISGGYIEFDTIFIVI